MALSFLTLAGTLNRAAETRYVIFEQPKKNKGPKQDDLVFEKAKSQIRLVFALNEGIVVALFHHAEVEWGPIDNLAVQILKQFSELHEGKVEEMKEILEALKSETKEPPEGVTEASIMKKFKTFNSPLKDLCSHSIDQTK